MRKRAASWVAAVALATSSILPVAQAGLAQSSAEQSLDINTYLAEGTLADGETAFQQYLATNPDDDQARYSLGMLQFFQAVEQLAQSWHRYGLDSEDGRVAGLPFLRLPTPPNRTPQPIGNKEFRAVFQAMNVQLAEAEATLAQVDTAAVKVPVEFGEIRLDLDGDGISGEGEEFWQIYTQYNRRAATLTDEQKEFAIAFDGGDVHWLRGYCHLLMAMTDVLLAHDTEDLFERTGQLFFPVVKTPHTYLLRRGGRDRFVNPVFADWIALLHLIRLDPIDPPRLQSALTHLEATIAQSKLSWDRIEAETDNDREWIPNPEQTSVVGVPVTPEMIEGWRSFLDESEALLAGEKLVPHWRIQGRRGINLRRVFTEPTTFDVVLWAQGSAATPYLETGELSAPETWGQLRTIFRGNFVGFAIWFN